MRGKVERSLTAGLYLRITPAHAGKSDDFDFTFKWYEGSPPHMRGKERDLSYQH